MGVNIALAIASMGGAGGSGTPVPPVTSNLKAWYRADLGVTVVGGKVTAWADSSGLGDAGRNLVQATGANQPTFTASSAPYGGQPVVTFGSGANQSLASGSFSAAVAQPLTVIIVGNAKDTASNYFFLSGTTARVDVFEFGGNGAALFPGGAFLSSLISAAPPSFICGVFNGASSTIAVNARTPADTGGAGANTIADVILGNVQGLGAPLVGPIAELAIYSGVMSAPNISAWATYVTNRYGIAVGP